MYLYKIECLILNPGEELLVLRNEGYPFIGWLINNS